MKEVATRGMLLCAIRPLGAIRVLAVVVARAVPALRRVSPRAVVTGCLGGTAEQITQRRGDKEKRRTGISVFSFSLFLGVIRSTASARSHTPYGAHRANARVTACSVTANGERQTANGLGSRGEGTRGEDTGERRAVPAASVLPRFSLLPKPLAVTQARAIPAFQHGHEL